MEWLSKAPEATQPTNTAGISADIWALATPAGKIKPVAEALGKPADNNEGVVAKLGREAAVFGEGLGLGVADGAGQAWDDKAGTALRLGTSLAVGALVTALNGRAGMLRLAGRAITTGFMTSTISDVVAQDGIGKVGKIWNDTWESSANRADSIASTRQELGRFAFDTIVLSAGGAAGAKCGELVNKKLPGALSNLHEGLSRTLDGMGGLQPAMAPATAGLDSARGARHIDMGAGPFSDNNMYSVGMKQRPVRDTVMDGRKPAVEPGKPGSTEAAVSQLMPRFSDKTNEILTGDKRTMAERNLGSQYSAFGLPQIYGYKPNGMKDIVPYSKLSEIIDPLRHQPKKFGSLQEMGEQMKVSQRHQLGLADAAANDLRDRLSATASTGRVLQEQGAAAQAHFESLPGHFAMTYSRWDNRNLAREVVDAERRLEALEREAKDISVLRLESARIGTRLKKLDGNAGAEGTTTAGGTDASTPTATAGDAQSTSGSMILRTHLQEQQAFLQNEITNRSQRVGTVGNPDSPIATARRELATAKNDSQYEMLAEGPEPTPEESKLIIGREMHHERQARMNGYVDRLLDGQRAIDANAMAQKENAVTFSELVYAYQARLKALQENRFDAVGLSVTGRQPMGRPMATGGGSNSAGQSGKSNTQA